MIETKIELDSLQVASFMTGIMLYQGNATDMGYIAEVITGREVSILELVDPLFLEEIREPLREAFPDMPSREEAEADYQSTIDKVLEKYGTSVMYKLR